MSHFFHDVIVSPRISFNEGFKAFFGIALITIVVVGAICSLLFDRSLPFGFGVLSGFIGGAIGFVTANVCMLRETRISGELS